MHDLKLHLKWPGSDRHDSFSQLSTHDHSQILLNSVGIPVGLTAVIYNIMHIQLK